MAKTTTKYLLSLAMSCMFLTGMALEVPPTPKKLVNDYAKVLSSSEVAQLESKLLAYNDSTSTQIAVVMIASLEGDDLFDFSQRLAEKWGIGGKENSNGVLLLVSVGDRKIRIHTGYGTEGAIPDAIAKRIIEQEMKPAFKNGNYYQGIDLATTAMAAALAGEYTGEGSKGDESPFPIWLILLIFLIVFLFARRQKHANYSRGGRGFYAGPFIGGFGGGSSGFGGGGGGFGGFGGGGFGGGGASGGW